MSDGAFAAFLESGVRFATPLAYAALGELVVERAGGNQHREDSRARSSPARSARSWAPAAEAQRSTSCCARRSIGIHSIAVSVRFFVVTLRTESDHRGHGAVVCSGFGLDRHIVSLSGMYGSCGAALHTLTIAPLARHSRWLSAIPVVGPALFDQPVVTYALYLIVPALAWWFYRTTGGLALRCSRRKRP